MQGCRGKAKTPLKAAGKRFREGKREDRCVKWMPSSRATEHYAVKEPSAKQLKLLVLRREAAAGERGKPRK